MRFPLAVLAVATMAIAIAACGGGGTSQSFVAAPSAAPLATGAVALAQSGTTINVGTANGITGALTFGAGSGQIVATSSSVAPSGTVTVVPADIKRGTEAASPTSPIVYYVTISSIAGATISGLPGVSLALPSAAIGTYQEAQFTNGAWANVSGATATLNASATAVQFPIGTTSITIPASGSIFLAFYQGNYPLATPTPIAVPSNVLADSGFESGSYVPFGGAVTSTGWAQCTISKSAAGAPNPNRPFSNFTPTPNSTPGAFIEPVGTSVPVGSATPHPTQTTVPDIGTGGSHAAVFGGVFSTFNLEDLRYNGLCQLVTVPNNPTASMSLFANGNDGTSYFDFEVDALDTTGAFLGNLYEDKNPISSTSSGDTAFRSATIANSTLQPYAGKTIELFVGAWINGGSSSGSTLFSTYYFLDNVLLVGTKQ